MKRLLICSLFGLFACHHDAAPQTPGSSTGTTGEGGTAQAGDEDEGPAVDPTLPSWAPRSCKGYHAAVVKIAACNDIDQAARDQATKKYDADNKGWHDMTNASQSDLDQVQTACRDSRKSVNEQMAGKCSNVQPVSSLE